MTTNASGKIDRAVEALVESFRQEVEQLINDAFEEGQQDIQEKWDTERMERE